MSLGFDSFKRVTFIFEFSIYFIIALLTLLVTD